MVYRIAVQFQFQFRFQFERTHSASSLFQLVYFSILTYLCFVSSIGLVYLFVRIYLFISFTLYSNTRKRFFLSLISDVPEKIIAVLFSMSIIRMRYCGPMERFTSNTFVWNVSIAERSNINKSINEKANKFSHGTTMKIKMEFICTNKLSENGLIVRWMWQLRQVWFQL